MLRETNKKMNKEHFLYDGRVEENQRCEPEEATGCCNIPCLKKCLRNVDGALWFPLCCLNQPQSHVQKIKIRGRFNAWILFPLCMKIMQCKRYNLDMVYLLSIFSLNVLLYVGYTISVISNKMSVM